MRFSMVWLMWCSQRDTRNLKRNPKRTGYINITSESHSLCKSWVYLSVGTRTVAMESCTLICTCINTNFSANVAFFHLVMTCQTLILPAVDMHIHVLFNICSVLQNASSLVHACMHGLLHTVSHIQPPGHLPCVATIADLEDRVCMVRQPGLLDCIP